MKYFLAGDIGGTKTLLQVFQAGRERAPVLCKSYFSTGYPGLAEIIDVFLREAAIQEIASACFALAGPVLGRKAKLTNLPWEVDADALAARFHIKHVSFINDFEAVGLGITALDVDDLLPLQQRELHERGVRIVVGAGTGLGVAWLSWGEHGYEVHPSEGGHIDFAPTNELQYALLAYLQQRHGHVSYERIVSGPGLVAIFDFLRDARYATPSVELITAMNDGDKAAAITYFAGEQREMIAVQTLKMFMQIYGAFVGNIALATLPRGGVYIAGGIAAKIVAQMQQGEFLQAFLDKGRFGALLATLPLFIVRNPQVGLLGASIRTQN